MKLEAINWGNYMFNEQRQPINAMAKISEIEKELGVKFPEDFLDISMKHQGQTVDDLSIKVRTMEVGFTYFFLFTERDGKYDSSSTIEFMH